MNIGLMLLYGNNNKNIFFRMADDIGENRPKVMQNITQQIKKIMNIMPMFVEFKKNI